MEIVCEYHSEIGIGAGENCYREVPYQILQLSRVEKERTDVLF